MATRYELDKQIIGIEEELYARTQELDSEHVIDA
jgi:hypothetical protein